jgi:hypothetical protein
VFRNDIYSGGRDRAKFRGDVIKVGPFDLELGAKEQSPSLDHVESSESERIVFLESAIRKIEQVFNVTSEAKSRSAIFVLKPTESIGKRVG